MTVRAAARSRLLRMCLTKTEHDGNRGTLEGAPACRSQFLYRSPPLPVLLPEKIRRSLTVHSAGTTCFGQILKVRPLTGLSPGQQIGRKNL